jgi:predicted amino acid-binding ACT domain protein
MYRKLRAFLILPLAWFLLAALIKLIEGSIADANAKFYGEFFQLCFSSWPAQLTFDRHSWWFAIGTSSRLVLVLGSFAGIIAILESMIRQRKLPMKYVELVALRDNTIRDILLANLAMSDQEKEAFSHDFDEAVMRANEDVKIQIKDIFTGEQARRVLDNVAKIANSQL